MASGPDPSDNPTTPSRHPSKASLFTFSKVQPTLRQSDLRSAPQFSLESANPIRPKRRSDLLSQGDWSTSASSRVNSSFSGVSLLHSGNTSGLKQDSRGEIEAIRRKLEEQERRVVQCVSVAREKEGEVRKLEGELKVCGEQNELLRGVVKDYERQMTLGNRTNASLDRVLQQKNCEIAALKAELALLKDQMAAQEEAQKYTQQSPQEEKSAQILRELEGAKASLRELTLRNAEMRDELSRYKETVTGTKKGALWVTYRQISTADRSLLQGQLTEIEEAQMTLTRENSQMKQEISTLMAAQRHNQSHLSELCGDLYQLKCSVTLLARVLSALKDGATFSLNHLLRSKNEWGQSTAHTLADCIQETKQITVAFAQLESYAIDWYSSHCGEHCKVA